MADAGDDMTVAVGESAYLDGTRSTNNSNKLLSYTWSFVSVPAGSSDPLSNAGPDQFTSVSSTVRLDGSASTDVDEDALSYSWAFASLPSGSSATLSDTTSVQPSFTRGRGRRLCGPTHRRRWPGQHIGR